MTNPGFNHPWKALPSTWSQARAHMKRKVIDTTCAECEDCIQLIVSGNHPPHDPSPLCERLPATILHCLCPRCFQ